MKVFQSLSSGIRSITGSSSVKTGYNAKFVLELIIYSKFDIICLRHTKKSNTMKKPLSSANNMFGNSKNEGTLTFFAYYDGKEDEWIGVCMEMDIVKVGKTLKEVQENLMGAVLSVLDLVAAGKLSVDVLNKPAEQEYWDIFVGITERPKKTKKKKMKVHPAVINVTTAQDVYSKDFCLA